MKGVEINGIRKEPVRIQHAIYGRLFRIVLIAILVGIGLVMGRKSIMASYVNAGGKNVYTGSNSFLEGNGNWFAYDYSSVHNLENINLNYANHYLNLDSYRASYASHNDAECIAGGQGLYSADGKWYTNNYAYQSCTTDNSWYSGNPFTKSNSKSGNLGYGSRYMVMAKFNLTNLNFKYEFTPVLTNGDGQEVANNVYMIVHGYSGTKRTSKSKGLDPQYTYPQIDNSSQWFNYQGRKYNGGANYHAKSTLYSQSNISDARIAANEWDGNVTPYVTIMLRAQTSSTAIGSGTDVAFINCNANSSSWTDVKQDIRSISTGNKDYVNIGDYVYKYICYSPFTYSFLSDSVQKGMMERSGVQSVSGSDFPTVSKTGYSFVGWKLTKSGASAIPSDSEVRLNMVKTPTQWVNLMNNGKFYQGLFADCTFEAVWAPNTNTVYVVNHYVQNADLTTYSLNSTVNKMGTSDVMLTLSSLKKTISYYSYVGGNAGTKSSAIPGTYITQASILANGKRVINLFYDRDKYKLTLTKGTGISKVTGGGTYAWGSAVSASATVSSGYTWKGWTGDATSTKQTYSFTMPHNAVSITAQAITKIEPTTKPPLETEPVTEPATEPVTEPAIEPVTEPVTEPITEPATEPVTQPTTEPVTEPATEPTIPPATEPVTQPPYKGEAPKLYYQEEEIVSNPSIYGWFNCDSVVRKLNHRKLSAKDADGDLVEFVLYAGDEKKGNLDTGKVLAKGEFENPCTETASPTAAVFGSGATYKAAYLEYDFRLTDSVNQAKEGTKYYTLMARDSQNHITKNSITVYLDMTPPILTAEEGSVQEYKELASNETSLQSTAILVHGIVSQTGSDALSGVARMCVVPYSKQNTYDFNRTSIPWSYQFGLEDKYPKEKAVIVKVWDQAGNLASILLRTKKEGQIRLQPYLPVK